MDHHFVTRIKPTSIFFGRRIFSMILHVHAFISAEVPIRWFQYPNGPSAERNGALAWRNGHGHPNPHRRQHRVAVPTSPHTIIHIFPHDSMCAEINWLISVFSSISRSFLVARLSGRVYRPPPLRALPFHSASSRTNDRMKAFSINYGKTFLHDVRRLIIFFFFQLIFCSRRRSDR